MIESTATIAITSIVVTSLYIAFILLLVRFTEWMDKREADANPHPDVGDCRSCRPIMPESELNPAEPTLVGCAFEASDGATEYILTVAIDFEDARRWATKWGADRTWELLYVEDAVTMVAHQYEGVATLSTSHNWA